jgi:hypothetical protein
MRHHNFSNILIFFLVFPCFVGLQWVQLQKIPKQDIQQQFSALRLEIFKYFPVFGYRNLIANVVFLQFLQYFGDDDIRQQTGYQLSPKFFSISVQNDPFFIDQYVFLSASTTLYAGQPERSIALMNQGLQNMEPNSPSRSYLLWRYKGTDELLFLGKPEIAQQSFRNAADWARQSSDPEAKFVAEISERTAQFLAQKPSSRFAQINAWVNLFTTAVDNQTQELAKQRIQSLGGSIDVSPEGGISVVYPEVD